MPTTTDWPRVDVGALAASLHSIAARAISETIVLAIERNAEDDNPLNEVQKMELLRSAQEASSNLEAQFARELIARLERDGVHVWGLSADLERILGR